ILSQKISNLSRMEADTLRVAISKKNRVVMNQLKQKFIEGGVANKHSTDSLEKIWKDWEAFAEYAFNKSHSTCYARLGYQTAYLKANYPAQYMAATLSNNLNNIKELTKLMDECRRMKIAVLGPDLNESIDTFTVNSQGKIRFGMAGIKGVGANAVESIVKNREEGGPYLSIIDFFERINLSAVNKKSLEGLIYAGAFDSFGEVERQQFFTPVNRDGLYLDALIKYGSQYQADKEGSSLSLFGDDVEIQLLYPEVPPLVEANKEELLKREKELIGIYLSAHPLDDFRFEIDHLTTCSISEGVEMAANAKENPAFQKKEIIVAGMISNIKLGYTKSRTPSASFTIEDFGGSTNFYLFGRDYENFMQYFQTSLPLLLRCEIAPKYGFGRDIGEESSSVEYELKIRKIRDLANSRDEAIKNISIALSVEQITSKFRKLLVEKLKESKGKTHLSVKLIDRENKIVVDFLSLKYRVLLSSDLLNFFDRNEISYSFTPSLSF
ncbi:MAG: DNA polymerase III subunit alpha, partial [Bacteroidales bacterium]